MSAHPLRILALTKSTGGLAFYNRALLLALDAARFESHTLCLSEGGARYAADLGALGLSAEPMAMARYRLDPLGDLRLLARVIATARARRPDVMVAHGAKAGVIARIAGIATGTPAIVRQASLPFLARVQGRRAPLYWALETATRPLGGHMVALTDAARRATIAHRVFPAARITVIHTGVDTTRFAPGGGRDAVVAGLGLDPARPVIGWVGRFEPQKAPFDFLDALGPLAAAHPGVQVVMAGEGRLQAEIGAAVAARGLGGVVRLLPWQTDMPRLLEGFDIYALSSRWEGLPITLLEAMAVGAAPVATAIDGAPDVIEPGVSGLLVPPADPVAMTAALGSLLADPPRRLAMGRAARARIEARFQTASMVRAWEDLLQRTARGARPAALVGRMA